MGYKTKFKMSSSLLYKKLIVNEIFMKYKDWMIYHITLKRRKSEVIKNVKINNYSVS